MPILKEIISRRAPLSPTVSAADVYQRFAEEPDALSYAVITDGKPVGLVNRFELFLRLADRYGRPLFEHKPIEVLMDRSPLVIDAAINIEVLNSLVLNSNPEALQRGLIVMEDGAYLGVATALDLLRATVENTRRRNAELESANREAQTASLAKSRFLASVSHELRTPLNAILGFTETMQHEIFGAINPPKYREYINYINTSGRHLLSLITDILDIARIEANRIELYEEEVVPAMIMADVEGIARSEAESAGITLAVQGDASLPNLYADSRRLVQILLNLVANAVKFSPQGSTVSLQALRSAQGLVFSVVDKGVGMRPEDIEKALTPFTQLHQDAAVARKGSGLGLAIVKGLTEAHGGQLHIESKPGEGTTVYVVMPHKRIIAARRTA